MGKFDGILICSDWDGTLHTKQGFNQEDIKAINYFMENGGSFTICSGRYLPYLTQFFDQISPNTYVITLNGAIIIHPTTKDIIYKGFLDESARDILDILVKRPFSSIMLYFDGQESGTAYTIEEYGNVHDRMQIASAHKAILIANDTDTIRDAKSDLVGVDLMGHTAVSSWPYSIEIIKNENAKGEAIKRLKRYLGAKLLVAVGDYENDLSMIEAADIGYAMGDAVEALISVADRITLPSGEGAIAKIIADIEADIS